MSSTHGLSPGLMASLRQQRRFLALLGVVLFFVLVWYITPWSNVDDFKSNGGRLQSGDILSSISKPISINEYNYKIDIDQVRIR